MNIAQNFILIWLDPTIDQSNEDCSNSIGKLRRIVNTIKIFTDPDECLSFISEMKDENIFLVVPGALGSTIVPKIHLMSQINSIFVFCGNKSRHEQWAKDWVKVKGVYTDIDSICQVLKEQTKQCDRDSTSISITNAKTANELEATFMYTTLFKEIILEIKYDQDEINKMANECRQMYSDNEYELQIINEFEQKYYENSPIWWYTRQCFLYQLLNRALRTFETSVIVAMGFFIHGLHRRIEELHAQQRNSFNRPFVVYRGQGLSETDFDKLKQSHCGLLSFNNFLSTSQDRNISQSFAREALDKPENMAILFRIEINPELTASPFAALDEKESYFGTREREILFSMNSIFRIGQVKQLENNARLFEIQLTLTNNNDTLLQGLTDTIREEVSGSSGWHQLGKLLIQSGDFDEAEQLYDLLLERTSLDDEGQISFLNHQLGHVKQSQGEYSKALEYYEKSHEIYVKSLPPNHPDLATSYNNIGLVYSDMGQYSKALEYYEKDLEITRKSLPPNHPSLATSYSNIGQVYSDMGEYSKALEYHEKSMEIQRKSLPPNHPSLATSYNNIGGVYSNMGEYSKALEYYEESMKTQRKSLPPNHPSLATSYNNIGGVYSNMGEYSKALEYYEESMKTQRKSLPPNHPSLATSYNNIGLVYSNMGEYSKALEYYEKSHEIYVKSLPPNHPDLATSYNNIGSVYSDMGEYSKALEYHEKSHEIYVKSLPPNHPSLATSYSNIGQVYSSMGEYSKALEYYEKNLEITKKSLSPNHPAFGPTYSRLGRTYRSMKDYLEAYSYFEKALEICKKCLAENHLSMAVCYSNIGDVKRSMGDSRAALEYLEKAVQIQENVRCDRISLGWSYNYLGEIYRATGKYSKALECLGKAKEIGEKMFPGGHPYLASTFHNLAKVYNELKDFKLALENAEKAVRVALTKLSEKHPDVLEYQQTLLEIRKKLKWMVIFWINEKRFESSEGQNV